MKIIELKAENIKNLRAIEIKPDGTAVILTGKNGAGKSAILDCIFSALTGQKLEKTIRNGEHRAEINVDMGSFTVRKIFTDKGARLEVMNKDGDVKKSPQQFLDNLLGKLSFDPLEFANLKPKVQRDLLKDLVGLSFDDINEEQQGVYDDRTGVNSKIREAIACLKEAEAPDPDTPEEEKSFKSQVGVVNQLREKRDEYLSVKHKRTDALTELTDTEGQINSLRRQIVQLNQSWTDTKAILEGLVLPPEVTNDQIQEEQAKLSDLEDLNVKIRAAGRYRKLIKDSNNLKEDSDKLTEKITRLEQDKSTRVANAEFPIEGLSINDDSVLFGDVPMSQLSTGQQIRVSTAIAMALNPDLKVLLCREGSLLDSEGLAEVIEMAKDKDYQLWIEKVSDSSSSGIFIENGSIKAIDGEEVKNEAQDVCDTGENPVEEK